MKVRIKLEDKNAKVPFKKYDSDFCYDCVAVSEEQIAPNVWKYGFGFSYEIVREDKPMAYTVHQGVKDRDVYIKFEDGQIIKLGIEFRQRSSSWETGMILSNALGTLDEHFRGCPSAVFYHLMTDMPRYKVGDRVGQICISLTFPIEWEITNELSDTDRGKNGYGHTGK